MGRGNKRASSTTDSTGPRRGFSSAALNKQDSRENIGRAALEMTPKQAENTSFHSEASLTQYAGWLQTISAFSQKRGRTPTDVEEMLSTLKTARNKLIGNKEVKLLLVRQGIIQRLVDLIDCDLEGHSLVCKRECAVMLGSIAMEGEPGIVAGIQTLALRPLLRLVKDLALSTDEAELQAVEAASRTLRTLFKSPGGHRDIPFERGVLEVIVRRIGAVGLCPTSQYLINILANCCDSAPKQLALVQAGVLDAVCKLVEGQSVKGLEMGLDLLAAISRDNAEVAGQIILRRTASGQELWAAVNGCASSHPKADVRLLAAIVLTNVYRSQAPNLVRGFNVASLLATLTQLLDEEEQVQARAPLVLAFLLNGDEALQLATIEHNTMGKLVAIVEAWRQQSQVKREYCSAVRKSAAEEAQEQACENALLCLATITASKDDCRKLLIESGVLKTAVQLIGHDNPALRSAACQCIRSLSRSVKNLRTSLMDAGVIDPIIKLLKGEQSVTTKTAACATICNLVLDFSPMKTIAIQKGVLGGLVAFLEEADPNLRLNAIWAIKNLLYMADEEIKKTVLACLTFEKIFALCTDKDAEIQVQALNILRNLACGEPSDIMQVLQGFGTMRLLAVINEKMKSPRKEIALQALYIVVNVATGGSLCKGALMSNAELIAGLTHILNEKGDEDLKLASVWAVINLTWPEEDGSAQRLDALRKAGVEAALHRLRAVRHKSIDLNDRTTLALEHFTEFTKQQ